MKCGLCLMNLFSSITIHAPQRMNPHQSGNSDNFSSATIKPNSYKHMLAHICSLCVLSKEIITNLHNNYAGDIT